MGGGVEGWGDMGIWGFTVCVCICGFVRMCGAGVYHLSFWIYIVL